MAAILLARLAPDPEPQSSKLKAQSSYVSVHYRLMSLLPGKKITDIMGTPEYMAPEQIMGCYGPEADIWSAGVVMYVVMCGLPPFWASDRDGVKRAIVQKEVSFRSPKWSGISNECKDLIARMLVKNPADRILANSVLGESTFSRNGSAYAHLYYCWPTLSARVATDS